MFDIDLIPYLTLFLILEVFNKSIYLRGFGVLGFWGFGAAGTVPSVVAVSAQHSAERLAEHLGRTFGRTFRQNI